MKLVCAWVGDGRGRSRRTAVSLDQPTLLDLYPERIMPEPMSGCWLWVGADNGVGYGKVYGHQYAHKVSYEMAYGSAGDAWVLHRCDTPRCVNPRHLFLGTHTDNMRDKIEKGRHYTPFGDPAVRAAMEPRRRAGIVRAWRLRRAEV